ncbi:hypothetical protein CF326_g6388, partial [Tilletia indica]
MSSDRRPSSSSSTSSAHPPLPPHSSSILLGRPNSTPPTASFLNGTTAHELTAATARSLTPSAAAASPNDLSSLSPTPTPKLFTGSRPSTASSGKFEIPGAASQDSAVYTPLQPPPRPRKRRPGSVSLNLDDETNPTKAIIDAAVTAAAAIASIPTSVNPGPSTHRSSTESSRPTRSSEVSDRGDLSAETVGASTSPVLSAADPIISASALPRKSVSSGPDSSRSTTSSMPTSPARPPRMRVSLPIGSPIRPMTPSPPEDALKEKNGLFFKATESKPISVTLPRLAYQPSSLSALPYDHSKKNGAISKSSQLNSRGDTAAERTPAAVDLSVEAAIQDRIQNEPKTPIGLALLGRQMGSKSGGNSAESTNDSSYSQSKSKPSKSNSLLASAAASVKASLSRPGSAAGPSDHGHGRNSQATPRKLIISGPVAGSFQSTAPHLVTVDLPDSLMAGLSDSGLLVRSTDSWQSNPGIDADRTMDFPSTSNRRYTARKGSMASVTAASSNIHGGFFSASEERSVDHETGDDIMMVEGDTFFIPARRPSQATLNLLGADMTAGDQVAQDPLFERPSDLVPAASAPSTMGSPSLLPIRRDAASTPDSSQSYQRSPNPDAPLVGRGNLGKLS